MSCDSLYRDLDRVAARLNTECSGDPWKNTTCNKLGTEKAKLEQKVDRKCALGGLGSLGKSDGALWCVAGGLFLGALAWTRWGK
jgi:hypothetical protein